MEVVSALFGPIVELVMVPVKKQLGFVFSSTRHVRNMITKMKQLDGASRDVTNRMETNNISNLEIPARVTGWLEDVEKIKEAARSISSTGNGCFNLKMRYRAGRNAFQITEEIESLIKENVEMMWSNAQKPLGKVNSQNASTSALPDGDAQNDHFKSRDKTFLDALEFLQQDHKSQVLALCGMGGVGKTTMMEQLKKTAEDKRMFDYIVKVVVGQTINMFTVQQTVAEYMGQPLTETILTARADRLRIRFGKMLEEQKKVLVILDDLWEMIELKDIGLISPLPNGFKLLLTSRNENICTQMAVEAKSAIRVVRVDVMEELEARNFFWQNIGASKQYDQDLNQIGNDIVKRCGFLPLAIKLIATTLQFQQVFVWRDTLSRLKKNNLDKNVQEIIKISYTYLKEEEEKRILLLCGLFPDDFNIPVEELTRYAWGLQLLHDVFTLADARDRTKTCVQHLRNANLLIDSDKDGCVKMHDLVLAFVVSRVSKGEHPWMINHGDISKWSRAGMSESCKSISITCTGMSEFPRDFKYPSLSLLRLMRGDKSLKFPEEFYERMENLEVIAYEEMQFPMLPRSLQCSSKLRTLLLHQCSLMFDFSVIGELLNLEVLSFAHCHIRKLPSAIGNLKELKLLDLTGCIDLRIDNGVLKNLVKLEELYMRVDDMKAIRFTNDNLAELAEISKQLSALEVEFFDNNGNPENMLFTKIVRFRISMGRSLKYIEDSMGRSLKYIEDSEKHSFENTLMLVTNRDELLESRMNELFEKTKVLYLEVDGMNDLEEVLVESVHLPRQSFRNLRVLDVIKCENLRYLFTVPIVSGLMKLERLTVSQCPVLEVLAKSENGGDGVIKFQELKYLSLDTLPEFVGLCNTAHVIELPKLVELRLKGLHNFTSIYAENTMETSSMSSSNKSAIQPFFNKEVLLPKLEILEISEMNELIEIWPYQFSSSDKANAFMLREIKVYRCDNIVNLFPTNPMSLLIRLEELVVYECRSIEVLFNVDMSCVCEIEEYNSNLRRIDVSCLPKLRELWRMKGESSSDITIRTFQAVEKIEISECESFVSVFKPTINNSDVKALMNVSIDGRRIRPWEETGRNVELVRKNQEVNVVSEEEISELYDNIDDVVHRLKALDVNGCKEVEVVFEIESSSSSNKYLSTTRHNHQPPALLLPYLKVLRLFHMERMSHVWKCNWNKLVIPQNQSQSSSFHNLTSILMYNCHSIKYLFSPLMGTLLPSLKDVYVNDCGGIEEVVSSRDIDENDEMTTSISTHTDIISFPRLENFTLIDLPCLNSIDGGNAAIITTTSVHDQIKCSQVGVASWFLLQYSKTIYIRNCHVLSRVFPLYVCRGSDETCNTMTIPRSINMTLPQLPNLTILQIKECEGLEYIFTSSILESLKQLSELTVKECKAMQVIVKEDGEHMETSKTIVFPRLKSLKLADLPSLEGFFLGKDEFRWPLLEKVTIYGCPHMTFFTSGHSMTPKLNYIHTGLGKHSLECGINFQLTNVMHETQVLPMCSSSPDLMKLLQFPNWSFSNLVEVDAHGEYPYYDKLLKSRIVFPCSELHHLKNLEKLYITNKSDEPTIEEVFEGANDEVNIETQSSSVVVFPKLKEVALNYIPTLQHIWRSNRPLNFPNLTKVSISRCPLLGHVFTSCMVGSLLQLQELQISDCKNMDVIVEHHVEDDSEETRPIEIVFPCLKSITLNKLSNLKGFCVGKEAFLWPSLDTLEIKNCPEITVFTNGQSTTPKLKLINATFGLCHITEDPTSFIITKQQEGWEF